MRKLILKSSLLKKEKKNDGNLILYLPSQGFLFPIREAMDA